MLTSNAWTIGLIGETLTYKRLAGKTLMDNCMAIHQSFHHKTFTLYVLYREKVWQI